MKLHDFPHAPHRASSVPAPGMRTAVLFVALAALLLGAAGCADEKNSTPHLSIAGNYTDEWGSQHTITLNEWTLVDTFANTSTVWIEGYSNIRRYIVGKNDAVDSFNPGLYSRHDWTYYQGDLYYCTTAFDANSLAEAWTKVADPTDPTAGGCDEVNNFPWTNLTP